VAKNLQIPDAALADFCRQWKITELAVFGLALREPAFALMAE
jgi:hypothetical protein